MNFEPLGDRVVIRPDEKVFREKSAGTFADPDKPIVPIDMVDTGDTAEAQSGVIVAMGNPTAVIDDDFDHLRLVRAYEDQQRVVYSPWTGTALTYDGKTYKIFNESEIMGVLTDSEAQVEVA